MNNALLQQAYVEMLSDIDTRHLYPRRRRLTEDKGLSGIFLSSVSDQYARAKNRVMVVGCETAGWEPLGPADEFVSVEDYVSRAMRKHRRFFEGKLAQTFRDRGSTFHNFTRAVAEVADKDGLVYTNLFCFDWAKKSPIGCPEFALVKDLSKKLLHRQIAILQPQFIVFANGMASAGYRREFFPSGEDGRCSQPRSYPEITTAHYLWEFVLDGNIRCFRVHHPSARSKQAALGRNAALTLLGDALM